MPHHYLPTATHRPQAFYRCLGCGALLSGGRYCDAWCEQRHAERLATREGPVMYRLRLAVLNWAAPGLALLVCMALVMVVLP